MRWRPRQVLELLRWPRSQLAIKAAFAAAVAWQIGLIIPGPADEVPFYAPLGAVLAVSQTILRSARESAQIIYAILLGGGIAFAIDALSYPNPATVAFVVLVSVAAAGLPGLGSSNSWVPFVGLFVLIIGSGDSGDYMIGYVVQVLVGVTVGLGINALLPPLPLRVSARALDQIAESLAGQLGVVEEMLRSGGKPDGEGTSQRLEMSQLALRARTDLEQINDSMRGNFRVRRYRRLIEHERWRADALNETALIVQAMVSLLQAMQIEGAKPTLDDEDRRAAADALAVVADAVHQTAGEAPSAELRARIDAAIADLEGVSEQMAAVLVLMREFRDITAPSSRPQLQ